MESWFQRLLLITRSTILITFFSCAQSVAAQDEATTTDVADINAEYFDAGIFSGILNIEDFGSELVVGGNVTFNANEDFFLQFNYLQTSVALSSYEKIEGPYFSGADRDFTHFDFLIGYNLFLGEQFFTDANAKLSSVYLLAGIGDTEFGGEKSFTYTAGIGYQVALQRDILMRIDFRDYIYKTNIIGENNLVHNTQLSANLSYLF